MEKIFEGKRVIDLEGYNKMPESEKKKIEIVISEGKTMRTIVIEGKQYEEIQQPDSAESCFVSIETIERAAEKYVYEKRMRELIEKLEDDKVTITNAATEFYTYLGSKDMSIEQVDGYLDKIKNILDRSDFEQFMYVLFLNIGKNQGDFKQSKINFPKYISYGTLYQKITEALTKVANKNGKNSSESESVKLIRNKIREAFKERVDEKDGIIPYTKDRIEIREKELIIDLILEKIASTDVAETDEYVRLLKKIKLNDTYLTKLLNLGLLSDDEIMTFYRTDWLGNKIEGAIQRLKPEDRKQLEKRLEGPINEWVNFYAGVIAWEETNDDQFERNIDNLPPRIKKRVLDRIEEVRKEIEKSKSGNQGKEASEKEERSLETLLRNILSTEGEQQEKYIKSFKERKITTEDLVKLVQEQKLSYEDLAKLYEIKELSRTILKVVACLDLKSAIRVYMASGKISILNSLDWSKVNAGKLRTILLTEPNIKVSVIARIIVRMHQLGKLEMTDLEISGIFAYRINDNDALRAYFELVKNGVYNEDKIIELWRDKINENNEEEPYQQPTEEDVRVEELLEFFNVDKVMGKMTGYCEQKPTKEEGKAKEEKELVAHGIGLEEFLLFYRGLLDANRIANPEETQQIIAKLESELSGKILQGLEKGETTYLVVAIELLDKNVITTENMQEILSEKNQEKLIEMYGQGVDDKILLSLFKHGLVQEYILELVYQDIGKEEWGKKIQNNSIGIEDIVILCSLGILDKEHIKGIKFDTIDWGRLSTYLDETKLKNVIELLYLNRNIGFEEIKELKEMGILSGKEAETLLEQMDLEGILRKGLTSEDGQGVKGKTKVKEGSKKREKNGLPDREVFLRDLGFKPITDERGNVLVVTEGSFKGYKVYIDVTRKTKVIILEKDMQASTFIMHEAKAGEYFHEEEEKTTLVGSRSDWREKSRTDGSVIARLHTINWGKNIIETIVDVSSIFKFDDETKRCEYVKAETKRLCEANRDSIEYLRMVKEDFYAQQ